MLNKMRIYFAIVLATFLVVLIQSKSLPKTKTKNSMVPTNNEQVNEKTYTITRHQLTARIKRNFDCDVMDLILVIDSSEWILEKNWVKVLQFAKNIVSQFDLNPYAVRIGVITYSSDVEISTRLINNGYDVINVLNDINFQGGDTDTYAGLEVMRSEFNTSARPSVRRVGVLITGGQTNLPSEAIEQAKRALKEGIELYVTGISDNFDYQEALTMVEDPTHILQIGKFDDLVSPIFNYGLATKELVCGSYDATSNRLKNASPTTTTANYRPSNPLPPTNRNTSNVAENCDVMDMILVLCSSEAVHPKNWYKVLQLAKDIVGRFKLSPHAVRIGVITYSSNAKISIPLGDNGNDVIKALNYIDHQGGAVYTNVAFDVMREQFSTNARPNVRRVGVLITYEYSNKPDKTIEEAKLAREEGIELYVIGITERFGYEEEVLSMVENPQHILKIEKLDDLISPMFSYGQSTEQLICGETANDIPSNTDGAFNLNWSCDFESGNICDMIQDQETDQFDWTVHTGPTPSDTTGPMSAYSGSYYAYIEASDPRKLGDSAILYLPKFKVEGSLCVRFAYNMYGFGIDTLKLMKVTPSQAMAPLWLRTGDQGNDWVVESVLVDHSLGDQLLFLGNRGVDFSGDIAIDDIKITSGACP